jgi:hypothetical protein
MSNLEISFAGLVKNNNGMFKSVKQAEFLLSMCDNNVFITTGRFGKSYFILFYHCDKDGIVSVTKDTEKKKDVLTWKRTAEGELSMTDLAHVKMLKSLIKRLEKSITERIAAKEQYKNSPDLFERAQEMDLMNITEAQQILIDLGAA